MKKIEELFKSALKDHELPYSESAWNDMNKKLDARSGGASGNLKWILGAAGAVVVTVCVMLYTDNNTDVKDQSNNQIASTDLKLNEKTDSNESNELASERPSETEKSNEKSNEKLNEKLNTKEVESPNESNQEEVVQIVECCDEKVEKLITPVYRETSTLPDSVVDMINLMKAVAELEESTDGVIFDWYVEPNVCQNTIWNYSNDNNKVSIWLKTPSNNLIEIHSGGKHSETLSELGDYQIGIMNESDEFVSYSNMNVLEVKTVQIISDEALSYENGLPELHVEVYPEEINNWTFTLNDNFASKNQYSESFNLFNKGNHVIGVRTLDANGCNASSSFTFNVEDDYNLLAVNAFTPSSIDSRNRFFIPFALTQRDTPFTMIIIDPADGAVVFETSNSDMPWDGTDRNTGKMVDENKSYVWKVILEHPESNEKPEYLGTVVRL